MGALVILTKHILYRYTACRAAEWRQVIDLYNQMTNP
jgi:hypothetical protein